MISLQFSEKYSKPRMNYIERARNHKKYELSGQAHDLL